MRLNVCARVARREACLRLYALRLQAMSDVDFEAEVATLGHVDPELTRWLDSLSQREIVVLAHTGDVALVTLMVEARR